uniref:Retrotransposon gag domain-containing protein n=1 Tax=Ananas comosus var. bracteatus TaxID=296719 RepID=A0A6V7NPS2_ANACO|nr:unnamed protein product [Ananas comosus var. bracteatus]
MSTTLLHLSLHDKCPILLPMEIKLKFSWIFLPVLLFILFLSQRDRRLLRLHLAGSFASASPHLLPDHRHLPYHHPSRRSRRPPSPPPPWPAPGAYGFVESSSSSSCSNLSLLNSHTTPPRRRPPLRLRLPKAEVARLVHESTDAARKIIGLWVARNQHPSPTTPDPHHAHAFADAGARRALALTDARLRRALALGCTEPWVVEGWVSAMEKLFEDLFILEREQMRWDEFCGLLYEPYFPNSVKQKLEEDLKKLQQGERSVQEYTHEFTRLLNCVSFVVRDKAPNPAAQFFHLTSKNPHRSLLVPQVLAKLQ